MKQSVNARRQLQKEKRDKEQVEIAEVEERLKQHAPERGTNPLAEDLNVGADKTADNYWPMAKLFTQLPLSGRTLRGLANVGRDVLGAAKTGSGKTLAFLIPILEKLWRMSWSQADGLGALVISPTRELALQTFTVLREIGAPHLFSAGLLIGGTNYKAEQHRIGNMNILVATPGRLLQHMDESPTFRTENLQVLVLDEADQILSAGFQKEVTAIIKNLPTERQTMLFSATQTSSVSDLARLSLDKPEFMSIHAEATNATPDRLVQNYIIMDEGEKLNILWSFIKVHLRKKILVFFQSQRQVKFVFEAFRHMRPGLPVMHLHGSMGQATRREVFDRFDKSKFGLMLATDVAARGLDFEGVHWVIQLDCPDRVESYIHRVGRTARNGEAGRSTLFLLPSESAFREHLIAAKIPISKTNINSARALEIDVAIQALLIQKPELKAMAQKSLKSYLKAIYLMSDKSVFDVTKLNMEALARSYGLLQVPKIRFMDVKKVDKNLERMKSKVKVMEAKIKQIDEKVAASAVSGAEGDDALLAIFKKEKKHEQGKTKIERLLASKNKDVFSAEFDQFRPEAGNAVFDFEDEDGSDSDDGEILKKKKKSKAEIEAEEAEAADWVAPVKEKKEKFKINVHKDSEHSTIFKDSDDEEEELSDDDTVPFAKRVAMMIQTTDAPDREAAIEKVRDRRRKKVTEEKEERRAIEAARAAENGQVTLGNPISDGEEDGDSDNASNSNDTASTGEYYDSGSDNAASGSDDEGSEDSEFFRKNSKKRGRDEQMKKTKKVAFKQESSESDEESSNSSEGGIPRQAVRAVWKKKKPKTK